MFIWMHGSFKPTMVRKRIQSEMHQVHNDDNDENCTKTPAKVSYVQLMQTRIYTFNVWVVVFFSIHKISMWMKMIVGVSLLFVL